MQNGLFATIVRIGFTVTSIGGGKTGVVRNGPQTQIKLTNAIAKDGTQDHDGPLVGSGGLRSASELFLIVVRTSTSVAASVSVSRQHVDNDNDDNESIYAKASNYETKTQC